MLEKRQPEFGRAAVQKLCGVEVAEKRGLLARQKCSCYFV
jgi:hypothetical protein